MTGLSRNNATNHWINYTPVADNHNKWMGIDGAFENIALLVQNSLYPSNKEKWLVTL